MVVVCVWRGGCWRGGWMFHRLHRKIIWSLEMQFIVWQCKFSEINLTCIMISIHSTVHPPLCCMTHHNSWNQIHTSIMTDRSSFKAPDVTSLLDAQWRRKSLSGLTLPYNFKGKSSFLLYHMLWVYSWKSHMFLK